jgi:hypothetical protein
MVWICNDRPTAMCAQAELSHQFSTSNRRFRVQKSFMGLHQLIGSYSHQVLSKLHSVLKKQFNLQGTPPTLVNLELSLHLSEQC